MKRKKSGLIILAAVTALCLILTGCGGNKDENKNSGSSGENESVAVSKPEIDSVGGCSSAEELMSVIEYCFYCDGDISEFKDCFDPNGFAADYLRNVHGGSFWENYDIMLDISSELDSGADYLNENCPLYSNGSVKMTDVIVSGLKSYYDDYKDKPENFLKGLADEYKGLRISFNSGNVKSIANDGLHPVLSSFSFSCKGSKSTDTLQILFYEENGKYKTAGISLLK